MRSFAENRELYGYRYRNSSLIASSFFFSGRSGDFLPRKM